MTSKNETFPLKIEYLCFEVREGQGHGHSDDNIKGCNVKVCACTSINRILESTSFKAIIYRVCNL